MLVLFCILDQLFSPRKDTFPVFFIDSRFCLYRNQHSVSHLLPDISYKFVSQRKLHDNFI